MVAIEEVLLTDADIASAERRVVSWGLGRRRQERQHEEFREQVVRIRLTNNDDGATAAVFHGQKQLSRRERLMQEHREQIEAEARKTKNRDAVIVRRRKGKQKVECRHCGKPSWLDEDRKCERCKNDPYLVTARGTQTRSFIPRLEAQPKIDPLSHDERRIQLLVDELPPRERDVIERRYIFRQSDVTAAGELWITVAVFGGLARSAMAKIAGWLANVDHETV